MNRPLPRVSAYQFMVGRSARPLGVVPPLVIPEGGGPAVVAQLNLDGSLLGVPLLVVPVGGEGVVRGDRVAVRPFRNVFFVF